MTRAEQAAELFAGGYNCAQAVVVAFSDLTGLDDSFSAKMASSFGGGMGRLREVCGGVSGAFAVLGLLCGYDDPADKEGKSRHYADIRELARRFTERSRSGSIVCREILKNAGLSGESGGEAEARTTERCDIFPEDIVAQLQYSARKPADLTASIRAEASSDGASAAFPASNTYKGISLPE